MAAIAAAESSRRPRVLLLEQMPRLGLKLLASEPLIAAVLVLVAPVAAVFGMEPIPRPWLAWIGLAPLAVLLGDTLHKRLNQTVSVLSSRLSSANR